MKLNEKEQDVLYIVIPAYNEEENISSVIKDWYSIIKKYNGKGKSKLVIFNDGSYDKTSKIVKKEMKNKPLLEIVDKENSGHGSTLLYAYQYALDKGANFIFQTDSDGQTTVEEFHKFWELRNEYDMIIGYRKKREDGVSRIFVAKVLKYLIRFCFGVKILDANTPFRLMNRESLKECKKLIPDNFNLSNVILSVVYAKKQYKVKYIPITFRARQGGVNSINLKKIFLIGKKALKDFKIINKNLRKEGL